MNIEIESRTQEYRYYIDSIEYKSVFKGTLVKWLSNYNGYHNLFYEICPAWPRLHGRGVQHKNVLNWYVPKDHIGQNIPENSDSG